MKPLKNNLESIALKRALKTEGHWNAQRNTTQERIYGLLKRRIMGPKGPIGVQ